MIKCLLCNKQYKSNRSLRRHQKLHYNGDEVAGSSQNITSSGNACSGSSKVYNYKYCNVCKINIEENRWSQHKRLSTHKTNSIVFINSKKCIQSLFNNRIETYIIEMKINLI